LAGSTPGIIADAGMAIVAAGLTAVAGFGPPGLVGTAIAGPAATIACVPALLVWPVAIASWKGRPGGPGRRELVTAPAARPAPPP
jgi:hypothetical protein